MILDVYCKKHPTYQAKEAPESCHACWILFFLSGNSMISKRVVGIAQEGLQCNPKGILISKEVK